MKHFTPLKRILVNHSKFIKNGVLLLILLPSLVFANNTDQISPKIELHSPNTRLEVLRGGNIHVKAHLIDNQELASYRIVIRKGGISSDQYADAFSTHQQLDADGNAFPSILGAKTYELNLEVKVDENAIVGDYHFTLFLKDKAGNEQMVERFFYVCRH
ncbi:DUF4625 domain-containing protein [Ancylomarina sp.]|uniref:DUF4625 domain-containing protein n=1 Tax=Ancylomarina sp. TaxID=1970196 RepID=UPI003562CDB0